MHPTFLGLAEAREALAGVGVQLTERQMKRAAEPDAAGKRKLPFFIDPIDGKLRIERAALLNVYVTRQAAAARLCRLEP